MNLSELIYTLNGAVEVGQPRYLKKYERLLEISKLMTREEECDIIFPPFELITFGRVRLYLSDWHLTTCYPITITKKFYQFMNGKFITSGRISSNLSNSRVPFSRYDNYGHKTIPKEILVHLADKLNLFDYKCDLDAIPHDLGPSGYYMQIEGHRNIYIGSKVEDGKLLVHVCNTTYDTWTCGYEDLIEYEQIYFSIYDGNAAYRAFSAPGGKESLTMSNYEHKRNWLGKEQSTFLYGSY